MTLADVEAVSALARTTSQAPNWGRTNYERFVTGPVSTAPVRHCILAEERLRLAGFAAVQLIAGVAELESIVVAPEARRQGVGGALFNAIREWASSNGAIRLELEVRSSNQPAIQLYKRAGMIHEGLRKGYYVDPEEDAVLMGIKL